MITIAEQIAAAARDYMSEQTYLYHAPMNLWVAREVRAAIVSATFDGHVMNTPEKIRLPGDREIWN